MSPTEVTGTGQAARIAQSAAAIGGVRSAVVCGPEGNLIAAAGSSDPARDAALASFMAMRAEALPVDGDLRGMGKQLAGSHFSHLTISGDRGDAVLFGMGGNYLYVTIAPGRASLALGSLSTLARRFSGAGQLMRSHQP
jgi:predicted regulator of Ras-like GTPase activity (Roadblock/LC7/MglB family)